MVWLGTTPLKWKMLPITPYTCLSNVFYALLPFYQAFTPFASLQGNFYAISSLPTSFYALLGIHGCFTPFLGGLRDFYALKGGSWGFYALLWEGRHVLRPFKGYVPPFTPFHEAWTSFMPLGERWCSFTPFVKGRPYLRPSYLYRVPIYVFWRGLLRVYAF